MVSSVPGVPTNVSVVKLSPEIFLGFLKLNTTVTTVLQDLQGTERCMEMGLLIFFDAVSCCFTLFLATAEGTRYTIFVLVIP